MSRTGKHIVFEGGDFAGKSSTMLAVAKKLQESCDRKVHVTQHPGATELGVQLRQLAKNPKLTISPIARQCLYASDAINFVETLLVPALENGDIVLADRSSFISGLIYSNADKIDERTFKQIWTIIKPPLIDQLYIFQCPDEILAERMKNRQIEDHYDNKPFEFMKAIHSKYNELLESRQGTLALGDCCDNIIGVDSSGKMDDIVNNITETILSLI